MKIFNGKELSKYDGSNGTTYIAYRGKVYDVSGSSYWRNGTHHNRHRAGGDLTEALKQAPHSAHLLFNMPVVGEFKDSQWPSKENS